jgi:uncharacterized protein with FMN-binding domain
MPKRGLAALAITTVALILLINFKTPDQPLLDRTSGNLAVVAPSARTGTGAGATPRPGATAKPGATPRLGATATPKPATNGGAGSATVDGPVVSTRFGPVQVEVVVANGKISDVVPLQLPSGRRSGSISNYAEPILHDEALQAQSANIDFVSGATYTSDAYSKSLQAALDQAGVG